MSGTPVVVPFVTSGESTKTSAGRTTATGSTFFVVISEGSGQGGTQTPTDSKGNTYVQLGTTQTNPGGSQLRVYYCENGAGGAGHTATVTWGANSDASLWFIECPGVALASIDLATLAQSGATGPSPYSVTSGAPDAATDLFLGFASGPWDNYDAAGSGFTNLDTETNSGLYWTGSVDYRAVTPPSAAVVLAYAITSASSLSRMIVGLKPAAGGDASIDGAGGIATAEAFGSPTVSQAAAALVSSSIASGEAFGAPGVAAALAPVGVVSAEAFGDPSVGAALAPASVASGEAFGSPTLAGGAATLQPEGIVSAETFGAPGVTTGAVTLQPAGIASTAAVGAPTLAAALIAQAIASGEAFGTPTLAGPASITGAGGIASEEAFGVPQVGEISPTRWIFTVAPFESRAATIASPSRALVVPSMSRAWRV